MGDAAGKMWCCPGKGVPWCLLCLGWARGPRTSGSLRSLPGGFQPGLGVRFPEVSSVVSSVTQCSPWPGLSADDHMAGWWLRVDTCPYPPQSSPWAGTAGTFYFPSLLAS